MKEEIKSWIASKLILWAIILDPEQVMEIPVITEKERNYIKKQQNGNKNKQQ